MGAAALSGSLRLAAALAELERRRAKRARSLSFSADVDWKVADTGELAPFDRETGERVTWAPQRGSQEAFLECSVFEVLYEGNRGPGKSESMLMKFLRHVDRGFGQAWRGVIFRRSFPELEELIAKSRDLFTRLFPDARYNESKYFWRFAGGEVLRFRFADGIEDYGKHHGHENAFLGFDELTAWPDDKLYRKLMSTCRSSNPSVPRIVCSTTNPSGVGHAWVKDRWQLPLPPGRVVGDLIESFDDNGERLPDRVAIHGALRENLVFLRAEPNYEATLRAAASSKAQADAWIEGSWDIVAGGMFDDVWDPKYHVLDPAPLPKDVPPGWRIFRAYDDGQAQPFSVGWYAQSNGEPWEVNGKKIGQVRGDLVRLQEWYGWNGTPNEGCRMASRDVARQIVKLEVAWGIRDRVRPGPADSSIWNPDASDTSVSVASEMAREGVTWEPADKSPGSRVQGWKAVRDRFRGTVPGPEGRREYPGIYVSSACRHFIRTVPVLPRDKVRMDDADTKAEDHVADEFRYAVRRPRVVDTPVPHLIY